MNHISDIDLHNAYATGMKSQGTLAPIDFEIAMQKLEFEASQVPGDVVQLEPEEEGEEQEAAGTKTSHMQSWDGLSSSDSDGDTNSKSDLRLKPIRLRDAAWRPRRTYGKNLDRAREIDTSEHAKVYEEILVALGIPSIYGILTQALELALETQYNLLTCLAFHRNDMQGMFEYSLTVLLFVLFRSFTGHIKPTYPLTKQCGCFYEVFLSKLPILHPQNFEKSILETEQRLKHAGILEASWYRNIPRAEETSHVDQHTERWLKIFDRFGRIGITDLIMEQERNDNQHGSLWKILPLAQDPAAFKKVRNEILAMLCAHDDVFIRSCISRQVARHRTISNHPVRRTLKRYKSWSAKAPCQYINILCDRSGFSPTARQCDLIRQDLVLYLSSTDAGNRISIAIDFIIHPPKRWETKLNLRGFRRYTDQANVLEKGISKRNEQRRRLVREFLFQLDRRLQPLLKERPDHPMYQPLIEIGYTKNATERLRCHATHRNSNYIMNLVQAAFENRFPDRFVLQQDILSLCCTPWQTWLGEVSFTRMMRGYIVNAGGFSHHPAGYSNGSGYRKLSEKTWDLMFTHIYTKTNLKRNLEMENNSHRKLAANQADLTVWERFVEKTEAVVNMISMPI